jgi:RNA polymerase sigma-70 factor (ECF subfamily)
VSRPDGRLRGFEALRTELRAHHTDPHAAPFGDGPLGAGLPGPRGGLGKVVPIRPGASAVPDNDDEPDTDRAVVVDLVAKAQAGDADAFGQLYDRYLDVVYRYVFYRVGGKALAEDLVSETFLRALRRIGSFEWQGRDFAAWLITIARNIIADHYKSGRFRLEVSTADMLDADRATEGPESEVLEGITNGSILEAVKKLNSEQQECVVLRFLQGLSVLETAQAMGKSEGAIKALQYRAVRTLGRMLPKELVL